MQLILGLFVGTWFGILIAAVLNADKGDDCKTLQAAGGEKE